MSQACILKMARRDRASLIADGLDRVETGGFLGRIPAEEHASEGTYSETHHDAPWLNIDMALLLFLIAWLYYFVLNGNELSHQTVMHFFTSSLMMVSFPALIGCISLLSEDTAKLEHFGHIPPLISFFVLTETIISPYCNRKSFPLG